VARPAHNEMAARSVWSSVLAGSGTKRRRTAPGSTSVAVTVMISESMHATAAQCAPNGRTPPAWSRKVSKRARQPDIPVGVDHHARLTVSVVDRDQHRVNIHPTIIPPPGPSRRPPRQRSRRPYTRPPAPSGSDASMTASRVNRSPRGRRRRRQSAVLAFIVPPGTVVHVVPTNGSVPGRQAAQTHAFAQEHAQARHRTRALASDRRGPTERRSGGASARGARARRSLLRRRLSVPRRT
jgi:hypothetical protein